MKKKIILITGLIGVVIIISITFFIFTTTMSQPTAMKLLLPKSDPTAVDSTSKTAVSLLLFNDDDIYAYRGTEYSTGKLYTTKDSTLRKYLLQVKNEVNDSSFVVIIKPSRSSTYKNTVNVLDEMTINNIKRYAMVDIFKEEQKIIDSISKGK